MTEARYRAVQPDDAPWPRAQTSSLSGENAAVDDPGGRNAAVRV